MGRVRTGSGRSMNDVPAGASTVAAGNAQGHQFIARALRLVGVVALGLVCVPIITPTALDLLDGSWVLANSWAHIEELHWGSDLAYTYGPLGFLRSPVPFGPTLVAGGIAFWVGSAVLTVWATIRLLGTGPAAWLVAFLTASLASTVSEVSMPLVAVALLALGTRLKPTGVPVGWAYLGLGLASATLFLTKLNIGVTAAAVVACLAICGPSKSRAVFGLVGGFGVGVISLWLLSDGQIAGLAQFLRDGLELSLGYSHALSNGSRTPGAVAVYAAGVVLFLALVGSGWWAARECPRLVRVGVAVALAILGASAWLQGFGRFDPGHLAIYFSLVGAMCLPLVWAAVSPRVWRIVAISGCYLLAAGPLLVALGSPGGGAPVRLAGPTALVHPLASAGHVVDAMRLSVDESAREARLQTLRDSFASSAALPVSITEALGGASAHAEPQSLGAIWAAGGRWAPVPVYQTHMAYTEYLDRRNSQSLLSSQRTQVVLREDVGLDDANPLWQSPGLQLAYLCTFRESLSDVRWSLLVRGDDRCGPTRDLGEVQVPARTAVAVPQAAGIVVAQVAPSARIRGRVEVTCDGRTYPLMQPLPTGPLILRVPEAAGWTTQSHPLSCDSVEFQRAGGDSLGGRPARRAVRQSEVRWPSLP